MNFIHDVLKANEGNECPKDYLLWSAYAAMSLAAGRRYFLELEHFIVDCRIYVILVGPAGNRKTFARDFVVGLINEAIPDAILSANCESHQAIVQSMAEEENVRLFKNHEGKDDQERPFGMFVSELMNYMKIDPIGMTSFLTDIRDSKRHYNYKIKGKDGTGQIQTLWYPYFVLLACTAPDWLTSQIKSDEFCGGFGRRTHFICNDSDVRMKPFKDKEAKEAEQRCVVALREVHSRAAKLVLSPEADQWFWQVWYVDKKINKLSEDKFLRSWGRSRHIAVLQVAALSLLAEDPTGEKYKYVIQLSHIKLSIGLHTKMEQDIGMITSRMGKSEIIQSHQLVLDILKANDGIMPCKDLKLKTLKEFKNTQEQWSVLEYMKTNEQIIECKVDQYGDRMVFALPERVKIVQTPRKPQQ